MIRRPPSITRMSTLVPSPRSSDLPTPDSALGVCERGQHFLIGRRPVKFREIALAPCPVGGFLDSHALGVDQLAETVLAPGEILAPASRVADPGSGQFAALVTDAVQREREGHKVGRPLAGDRGVRSEESRVGEGGVRTGRSRWTSYN